MKNTKTSLQLRSYFNSVTKNTSQRAEYGIVFQTNRQRGFYYSQADLLNIYNEHNYDASGCSKMVYLYNKENDEEFKYITIKRMKPNFIEGCYLRGNNNNNNQIADELNLFLQFEQENNKYFELLNPILRYDTVKSDHNNSESKKALEKYIIVSLKAEEVDNWRTCCMIAQDMNTAKGLIGEYWEDRYNKGVNFANDYSMQDIIHNTGNSGVIYNPLKNCYESVFIDYAR